MASMATICTRKKAKRNVVVRSVTGNRRWVRLWPIRPISTAMARRSIQGVSIEATAAISASAA